MITETSDVEKAERLGRRRARLFTFQAIIFISWQGLFLSSASGEPMRRVDAIKISAWFVWVLVLLLMLATGGNLLRGRKLRALLNDEFTQQNRRAGYVTGFWAAVCACVGLYVLDMFEAVTGREAVHIVLSAAIAAALLTFAARERRSLRAS